MWYNIRMSSRTKQRKFLKLFAVIALLFFCAFSFAIIFQDISFTSAYSDFDSFISTLNQMVEEYDTQEESSTETEENSSENSENLDKTQTLSVSLSEENNSQSETQSEEQTVDETEDEDEAEDEDQETETQINRLIVISDEKLSSCDAVMTARYYDVQIFQYENSTQAEEAYNYYKSLGVVVQYDAVISLDDEEDTSTSSDETVSAEYTYSTSVTIGDYNNQSKKTQTSQLLGADNYVNNLQLIYGDDELELNEVTVVVLDTGINTNHVIFSGRLDTENAKNFTTEGEETDVTDNNGHGTHVSGVIADLTLENVTILPLKVLDGDGNGIVAYIVSAIEYVLELQEKFNYNVQLLNMSIGLSSNSLTGNASLEEAIKELYNNNIMPVVSAGNSATNVAYSSPANLEEAVVVTALKLVDGELVFDSSYSNYGSTVDFAAPGTNIYSASHKSNTSMEVVMSGTSMATPHVTAVAALVYSNPLYADCDVDEIFQVLQDNALDYGDTGYDEYYGYGCIYLGTIGTTYSGYIEFSEEEQYHDAGDTVYLTLKYVSESGEEYNENNVQIYYTTSETATNANTSNTLYTGGYIKITETTKITAVAYIQVDGSDYQITQSYVSSMIYYFDNLDLSCNYTFENGVLTEYSGGLTTLKVPTQYTSGNSTINVTTVGQYAFSGTNVQELYLPSTIMTINSYAFSGNTALQKIHCETTTHSVVVSTRAFYSCYNLTEVDIPKISSVGDYAFAYCKSLTSLELWNVGSIGKYALSGSGIEEVYIGKKVSSIGTQSNLQIQTVYGYSSTSAEDFAYEYNLGFVDLTLTITQDATSSIVIQEGETIQIQISYVGLDTYYSVYTTSQGLRNVTCSANLEEVDEYTKTLTLTLDTSRVSVGDGYQVYILITDYFGTEVKSEVQINIVSKNATTYTLSDESEEEYEETYTVSVNGSEIESGWTYYEGYDYTVLIEAEDGYVLRSVKINGVEQLDSGASSFEFTLNSTLYSEGVTVVIETYSRDDFLITFSTDDLGETYIEEAVVSSEVVDKSESVSFKVVANEGYEVQRVTANGTVLYADEDGYYTITNIVSDIVVEVTFVEKTYTITVLSGKGGTVSLQGGNVSGETISYGATSGTYYISVSNGYKIDTVTVNGEEIEISGNTFVLENVTSDCEVVVTFKKTGTTNGSVILTYFIVFLVIVAIFIVARVILYFVMKKKDTTDES